MKTSTSLSLISTATALLLLAAVPACSDDSPPTGVGGEGGAPGGSPGTPMTGGRDGTGGREGSGGANPATGGTENLGGLGGVPASGGTGGTPQVCSDDAGCAGANEGDVVCYGNAPTTCSNLDDDECLEATPGATCDDFCSREAPAVCRSGDSCAAPIFVSDGDVLSGDSFTDDFSDTIEFTGANCSSTNGSGNAEVVLAVKLLAGQTLNITETGSLDVVVGLQSMCGAASSCLLSWDLQEKTGLDYTATTDETLNVYVTNWWSSTGDQPYEIGVHVWDCGDGTLHSREQCDDGNEIDGDGCTACEVDFGFSCDTEAEPSTCGPAPSLGTFNAGEPIDTLLHDEPVPVGKSALYAITFDEVVWLSGLLEASLAGNPNLRFYDSSGNNLFSKTAVGADTFENERLGPGTYYIAVEASGAVPVSPGFELGLETAMSPSLGALAVGGQLITNLPSLEAGDEVFHRITISETLLLSGSIVGEAGDPDFWLYDANGEEIIKETSGGSTEDILSTEVSPGLYFVRARGFKGPTGTTTLTLDGANP